MGLSFPRLANEIREPLRHAKLSAKIVQILVAQGDITRAEELALKIAEPRLRADALNAVGRALGDLGELDRAIAAVQAIGDDAMQAKALARLASKFRRRDKKRLLMLALYSGHWQICLGAISELEPEAVRSLSKAYIRSPR